MSGHPRPLSTLQGPSQKPHSQPSKLPLSGCQWCTEMKERGITGKAGQCVCRGEELGPSSHCQWQWTTQTPKAQGRPSPLSPGSTGWRVQGPQSTHLKLQHSSGPTVDDQVAAHVWGPEGVGGVEGGVVLANGGRVAPLGRRDSECAIVHREAMSAFSRAISARTEATVGVTGAEGAWARERDTSANAHSARVQWRAIIMTRVCSTVPCFVPTQ
jgi:hypothetical protein